MNTKVPNLMPRLSRCPVRLFVPCVLSVLMATAVEAAEPRTRPVRVRHIARTQATSPPFSPPAIGLPEEEAAVDESLPSDKVDEDAEDLAPPPVKSVTPRALPRESTDQSEPLEPPLTPVPLNELEPPAPDELPGTDRLPPIRDSFSDPGLVPPPGAEMPGPTLSSPQNALQPPMNRGAGRNLGGSLGLSASLGATADSFSASPHMMGDLFGGGVSLLDIARPVPTTFFSRGTVLSGSGANAVLAFDFAGGTPNDIFTAPNSGRSVSGDNTIDQFQIVEPVPVTDAPTSPGPGFIFDGGTATYVGKTATTNTNAVDGEFQNGDFWYISYRYVLENFRDGEGAVVVAGPDVATRRSKLSENFSPELHDRFFLNYNFFNDAFGGLGDVSRYVFGFERILVDNLLSIEARLPMAGTYSSRQQISGGNDRDFELGNGTLIGKLLLLQTGRTTLTGGTGLTIPFADDARLLRGSEELLRIENEAVHLLPFLGVVHRVDPKTFVQAYSQLDVDLNGNPVFANLDGGQMRSIGTFNDATLIHLDTSVHRIVYRTNDPRSSLKGIVANAELHYTGTLQDSDTVTGAGLTVSDIKRNFNILNATFGAHLLIGQHLVVTPGMAFPLRDGLDEQFDYEAILQMTYLR